MTRTCTLLTKRPHGRTTAALLAVAGSDSQAGDAEALLAPSGDSRAGARDLGLKSILERGYFLSHAGLLFTLFFLLDQDLETAHAAVGFSDPLLLLRQLRAQLRDLGIEFRHLDPGRLHEFLVDPAAQDLVCRITVLALAHHRLLQFLLELFQLFQGAAKLGQDSGLSIEATLLDAPEGIVGRNRHGLPILLQ